ncbi:hypothetical protein HGRIS_013774 [Hohenbuehelia grisea]|uniref:DUF6593 domain-containing protein n=1 Tax=Hohenbuehelia grisea TaxID=104357 RepID=A0ABR3IWH8_9AGAR
MFQQLELTTTSLHNVVIANESDILYYEVVTPKWQPHLTTVQKFDPNTRAFSTIAELQNEGARSPRPIAARLQGGELRPVDEVVKKGDSETSNPLSWQFTGKDGRIYRWQTKRRHLELVRDDSTEKPVAVYHRHKRHLFVLRMSRRPYLAIDSSIMDTLDMVILSFLLAERQRRDSCRHIRQQSVSSSP